MLSIADRSVQDIPSEFVKRVQSAFLDGLYAFLDGLVHVAFSDPDSIFTHAKPPARRGPVGGDTQGEDGRPKEVDIRDVDTRILLTVSNLAHLRTTSIPRLVNQFQIAFKVEMQSEVQMLMDVTDQLDKILFDDYIKRKSADVAKIIRKGVLGGTVHWFEAPKPTGESHSAIVLLIH